MTAALKKAFGEAASGGRVGALKEVMTSQYARLAQLFEDLIARLVQDTEVRGFKNASFDLSLLSDLCISCCRTSSHPSQALS